MSHPDSGWTLATLYTHLNGLIDALAVNSDRRFLDSEKNVKSALEAADKAVAAALSAQEAAAAKAERSAEARHTELVQRLNQTADILTEKITSLALRYEASQGAGSGMDKAWGYLVGVAGITFAIIAAVFK